MNQTKIEVQKELPKIYSHEFIEVLFAQPYCRIYNLIEHGIAKRQTASQYLQKLSEKNIVKVENRGREKLFITL